jgi:hypothetical protein
MLTRSLFAAAVSVIKPQPEAPDRGGEKGRKAKMPEVVRLSGWLLPDLKAGLPVGRASPRSPP